MVDHIEIRGIDVKFLEAYPKVLNGIENRLHEFFDHGDLLHLIHEWHSEDYSTYFEAAFTCKSPFKFTNQDKVKFIQSYSRSFLWHILLQEISIHEDVENEAFQNYIIQLSKGLYPDGKW